MAYESGEGGGGSDSPFKTRYLPAGKPVIEYVRSYSSVTPFGLQFEFRPQSIENFNEKIEGDTRVDIIIDAKTKARFDPYYAGPYSQIISLIASGPIRRRIDIAYVGSGYTWSEYTYDSYYVQQIKQEGDLWRVVCVGFKEYMSKRLAIPSNRDSIDGVISTPDGSQEAKPIPSNAILQFTSRSQKGVVAGLLSETAVLQSMPVSWSPYGLDGSMQRTYLLKDMRSIKEAMNNMADDATGTDIIFDGGYGGRSNIGFLMTPAGSLQRGIPTMTLNSRTSDIFRPDVQMAQADSVNNIWTVGNASDGNIILGHKKQAYFNPSSQVLLQSANMERNDIQTPDFLLQFTNGILQKSGTTVRTMAVKSGLTPDLFLCYAGNYFFLRAPEWQDVDRTSWQIVERSIDFVGKRITFMCEELIIDNNGNGIPDRLEGMIL
jgi:hypothetical protein